MFVTEASRNVITMNWLENRLRKSSCHSVIMHSAFQLLSYFLLPLASLQRIIIFLISSLVILFRPDLKTIYTFFILIETGSGMLKWNLFSPGLHFTLPFKKNAKQRPTEIDSLYSDINECDLVADACHRDSYCSNYYSYHECICVSGYFGNGTICTGTLKDLRDIYKN